MKNSRYIIFDMDGVLFDTELLMIQCYEKITEEYHIPNVRSVCCECIGVNADRTQEIFMAHYGKLYPLDEIRNRVVALFKTTIDKHGVPMKPYVTELLQYLRGSGYSIAIASSTVTDTVFREVKQAGIDCYFDVIVGGDMVKRSKPAPDIFISACEKLGSLPNETYVIEDSINGLLAAHTAGTKPIAVPDLIVLPDEVRSLCVSVCRDLREVMYFFRGEHG